MTDDTDDDRATVLIVDDEQSVLDTYELYLSERYDVLKAENGGEALVELGPEVDVVLLDRRMPGMSGDEVLEHIREWEHNCRVAMVTAVDPGSDIVEMPFDDYLCKPLDRDELLNTVEQLLLFDEYERLLDEFHSVTKTYATLRAQANTKVGEKESELSALQEHREDIRAKLLETVEQFTDDEVAEVFRERHTMDEL